MLTFIQSFNLISKNLSTRHKGLVLKQVKITASLPARYTLNSLDFSINMDEVVGTGTYGLVVAARKVTSPGASDAYVAKLAKDDPLSNQYIKIEKSINEALALPCKGIIADYIGSFEYKNTTTLIWKNHGRHTLEDYLIHKKLDDLFNDLDILSDDVENRIRKFSRLLVRMLNQMHQNYVVHRDIKPSNILIDVSTKSMRFIDFGSAAYLSTKFGTTVGYNMNLSPCDPIYAAAELFIDPKNPYKFDVFSAGMIIFRLMFSEFASNPETFATFSEELRGKSKCNLDHWLQGTLSARNVLNPDVLMDGLEILNQRQKNAYKILKRMLDPNPVTRITTEGCLSDSWLH